MLDWSDSDSNTVSRHRPPSWRSEPLPQFHAPPLPVPLPVLNPGPHPLEGVLHHHLALRPLHIRPPKHARARARAHTHTHTGRAPCGCCGCAGCLVFDPRRGVRGDTTTRGDAGRCLVCDPGGRAARGDTTRGRRGATLIIGGQATRAERGTRDTVDTGPLRASQLVNQSSMHPGTGCALVVSEHMAPCAGGVRMTLTPRQRTALRRGGVEATPEGRTPRRCRSNIQIRAEGG